MAWFGRLLLFLLFLLSLLLLGVEGGRFGGRGGGFGRGFGGGGGGSRFGGRSSSSTGWGSSSTSRRTSSWGGSWGGRSSSFGSRYSAPTGRYSSYVPPVTRSYTGGYGRSSSSGGFGLGLGGGLLLGYSMGRLSSGGYGGYGYGHNYGQYNRGGGYSTERPISCYTASRVSEVVEDISLDEKLVRCDFQDDVCFGKVVLTVSNSSSMSRGILEVSKGCGKRMVLEASYKSKATYNAGRQCYVTNVVKNNRVVNNNFADSVNGSVPVLSDTTSDTTSTSTQEELCICEGSQCNPSSPPASLSVSLVFASILIAIIRNG